MFKLYFITSSRTKLMHARYFAQDYDVLIVPKANYGVSYKEPRIYDREQLLEESFKDAKERWFKSISKPEDKMFFIEDTSVVIHALSKDKEVPGVDVKYWMKENTFLTVDAMLRALGNNRSVTVRSDILLYLTPSMKEGDKEFKRFTSFSNGILAEKEYNFKTNPLYPWLDNKTFNKWFVPDGCKVPISKLAIAEANKFDFRALAFKAMFEFLKGRRIINAKKTENKTDTMQGLLPSFQIPIILVSGLPCAGKTTIGKYLSEKCGYYHIEASDFMHLSYYETHGIGSSVKIGDFAEQALKKTPNIVVDQIIENIKEIGNVPVVITGFRSPKEIDLFISHYGGSLQVEVAYISATQSLRFNRCVERGREDKLETKCQFRVRDSQQLDMGISEIKKRFRRSTIINNDNIKVFIKTFLSRYGLSSVGRMTVSKDIPIISDRPAMIENAILITLISNKQFSGKFITTTEIAYLINTFFDKSSFQTSKNNVSRYFNQFFHPYFEICQDNEKNKYRLSQTGISRAQLLLRGANIKKTGRYKKSGPSKGVSYQQKLELS